MEHIVASTLTKDFNQNDILYDLQYGFRERRSCETQLIQLHVVEDLTRNMTSDKQTDLILLDFSKAFDKVHPPSTSLKTSNKWCAGQDPQMD